MGQEGSGSARLTLGVEGTYLPRDRRGMGRVVRGILSAWRQADLPHRVVLLARSSRHLPALRQEMPDWEVATAGQHPPLSACWFPWNRVDFDPGCPRVLTLHDVVAFADPERASEAERRHQRRSAARADRIFTISEFSRSEIARHLHLDPGPIEVVPLGVEPEFHPRPRQARSDFLQERTGGRPFALFVGNSEPRKGLALLLEAFQALGDRLPHVLVLSGSPPPPPGRLTRWLSTWLGTARPHLESCLQVLGERVVWAGHPDDETLRDYYRHTDLFVCPSLYEGFGLPLLEAMACGAPVAAARRASLPEVGGEVPLWFDPQDPEDFTRTLQEGLERSAELRGRGIERAARFRWEDSARSILQILESCSRARPA